MENKVTPDAKFLIWSFDPCYEGGWNVEDSALTIEEAQEKCKRVHEAGLARIQGFIEYFKGKERDDDRDPKVMACYSKAMITPIAVFEIEA